MACRADLCVTSNRTTTACIWCSQMHAVVVLLFVFFDLLQCLFHLPIHTVEMLRHDFNISDDGHKVGIAVPAWHNVEVDMLGKACSGHFAFVDPHIEAVGIHGKT